MKKKIGISTGALQSRYGARRAMEICAEAGLDAIDFSLESYGVRNDKVYFGTHEEIYAHFKALGEYARSLGLEISQTHGRCITYTSDADQCAFTRWVSERDILATAALGAPACVIHSVSTYRFPDADGAFMHEKNRELYEDIIPFAEKYGVSVALETFGDSKAHGVRVLDYFGDARELKASYDSLNTRNKMLCMDTGHTNKAHNVAPEVPDTVEAIRLFGSELKLLHLNDNNGFTDQHLPPRFPGKEGSLVWEDIFAALDEIGYTGVYNFELNLGYNGELLEEYVHYIAKYLRMVVGE